MHEGDLLTYEDKPLKLFGLDYTELVYVEAGSFIMGDNNSRYDDEKPEITINFNQGFFIGKYSVTQELYNEVMGNVSSFEPRRKYYPVQRISYDDICTGDNSFLSRLNSEINEKYPILNGVFDLPSESQWEYAARGGKEWNKPRQLYSGSQNINDVAWYKDNTIGHDMSVGLIVPNDFGIDVGLYNKEINQGMPVGFKIPNVLGIYDMSGGVYEWCSDLYSKNIIKLPRDGSPNVNVNVNDGLYRVLRGGGWSHSADDCRIANRAYNFPNSKYIDFGFRLMFV